MSTVRTGASMSIDGYIAGPNESGFEHLFKWYSNGDVPLDLTMPGFKLTRVSADYFNQLIEETGVLLVGRRLWDLTKAWGGRHPMDRKTVVVTHQVPDGWEQDSDDFCFVTDGIEAAVAKAKEIAGDRDVAVNGGTIASQCLEAGLIDEIGVDLTPVLLGGGVKFFDQLEKLPVELELISVIEGLDVVHHRYRVKNR